MSALGLVGLPIAYKRYDSAKREYAAAVADYEKAQAEAAERMQIADGEQERYIQNQLAIDEDRYRLFANNSTIDGLKAIITVEIGNLIGKRANGLVYVDFLNLTDKPLYLGNVSAQIKWDGQYMLEPNYPDGDYEKCMFNGQHFDTVDPKPANIPERVAKWTRIGVTEFELLKIFDKEHMQSLRDAFCQKAGKKSITSVQAGEEISFIPAKEDGQYEQDGLVSLLTEDVSGRMERYIIDHVSVRMRYMGESFYPKGGIILKALIAPNITETEWKNILN